MGARKPGQLDNLPDAIREASRELGSAIRDREKMRASERKTQRVIVARRLVGKYLMIWAIAVFTGLVIGDNSTPYAALLGTGLFVGTFLLAYGLMRGGEW